MKRICLLIAFILLLSSCESKRKESVVRSLQAESHEYCIGRQNISLPDSFLPHRITTGSFRPVWPAGELAFEVIVRDIGITPELFKAEINKRRNELKNEGNDTVDVLRKEAVIAPDAVLFRVQEIEDAYVSEVNFVRGSALVNVRLDSFHNQYEQAEQSLRQFMKQFRERGKLGDAETAKGYCIGSLIVLGDYAVENGDFDFRDDRGDNFSIMLSTQDGYKDAPLLERMASPDSLLAKFNIHPTVIRAKQRTVAGMPAEEWLGWTDLDEPDDGKAFGFSLETYPRKLGKRTPLITISFETAQPLVDGTHTKNWMSDDEAVRLWDFVVASLK